MSIQKSHSVNSRPQVETMASIHVMVFAILAALVVFASAFPQMYILDDQDVEPVPVPVHRVARDTGYEAAPSTAYGTSSYPKGKVGPVYTFVKTDPKANFKWGVRHQVGAQYGR